MKKKELEKRIEVLEQEVRELREELLRRPNFTFYPPPPYYPNSPPDLVPYRSPVTTPGTGDPLPNPHWTTWTASC